MLAKFASPASGSIKKSIIVSQYPGGLKMETLRQVLAKHPERAIQHAVKGMLPHNRLGDDMLDLLKVYAGPDHPHQAQKPVPWGQAGPDGAEKTAAAEA